MQEIDVSRLSRDYSKEPLHKGTCSSMKGEGLVESDLRYLYLELNLSVKEILGYFNISKTYLYRYFAKYKIRKTLKKIANTNKRLIYEKYGVNSTACLPWVKTKAIKTRLKNEYDRIKYGIEKKSKKFQKGIPSKEKLEKFCFKDCLTMQEIADMYNVCTGTVYSWRKYYNFPKLTTEQIIANVLRKNRENHGGKLASQLAGYKEKIKQESFKKYGVAYPQQLDIIKNKTKNTNLKKYGCNASSQNEEVKLKAKQTNIEKYGVDNPSKSDIVKNKIKYAHVKKYGKFYVETQEYKNLFNQEKRKEIVDKGNKTKLINATFNTSKPAKIVLNILQKKFGIVRAEYSDKQYTFNCDFYIPNQDLYIEVNFHWTHGLKAYEGTKEDIEKVEKWRNKGTKYYNKAIEVWTERDVRKREMAKKNNLNWIEFFNINQFNNWLKEVK